ncbi:MAG: hypothetical protein ABSD75_25060 [Terriglobales bacterium]|jgi:hypothetical protein
MNNVGKHKPMVEPSREVVERAIIKVLEIAQQQDISAADFIQMLNSGMQISDFLNVTGGSMNACRAIDYDFVN